MLHFSEKNSRSLLIPPWNFNESHVNRLQTLKCELSLPKPMNLLFAQVMSEVPSYLSFPFVLNSQTQLNPGNAFTSLVFLTVKTEPEMPRGVVSPLFCPFFAKPVCFLCSTFHFPICMTCLKLDIYMS